MNHLYYGDNLQILKGHIQDGPINLVYLDPPLNGDINYNILVKSLSGKSSEAQIEAFEDTWQLVVGRAPKRTEPMVQRPGVIKNGYGGKN
jgi:hypothetical protein